MTQSYREKKQADNHVILEGCPEQKQNDLKKKK